MADWPFPCCSCQHPPHRGGECRHCICTYIPFARTLERQWLAFRYREASAWQVPGREGKWLIVRTSEEKARLHQYGPAGEWLAVTDANVLDLMPFEEE